MKSLIQSVLVILVLTILASGQERSSQSPQGMKSIVDTYAEVWNKGDLSKLDAIMDANYVFYANNTPEVKGIEERKKMLSSFRTAYPDMKLAVEDEVYSENAVAVRWRITGTNTGPGETPPTGKSVDFWGIAILRIANGKLIEEHTAYDNQSIMEQLGYTMTAPSSEKK